MSGESRTMNSALETINAAATAIAMAENRVPQASIRKRRWGSSWLSMYWCFGTPNRNRKRIGHVVPETTFAGPTIPGPEDPSQPPPLPPPQILLPFIAPPSSPASFLQSEPPSAAQSPVGLLSISASMYSPGGPRSIFAIGPYAHETQLVSPPVFYTEPSTAPVTPPPESFNLTATAATPTTTTTPPSPEVPFAQLLDPKFQRFPIFHNEFQSYHLQPGSPVGQLISPSSISGASSPFPDRDFICGPHFVEFRAANSPPKLLCLEKLSAFDWGSRLGSGCLTPDNGCAAKKPEVSDRRVSFELAEAVSTSLAKTTQKEAPAELSASEDDVTRHHQKHRSITLGSSKEFNFDNVETANSIKPGVGSDWWANEKVVGNEISGSENWSFFPIVQPSVS